MNWKSSDLNDVDKKIDNSMNSKKVIIEIVLYFTIIVKSENYKNVSCD